MELKLLFSIIVTILASAINAPPQKKLTLTELSKYSYYLYKVKSSNGKTDDIDEATAFFVKVKDKFYLISCHHTISGWEASRNAYIDNGAKELRLRLNRKSDNKFEMVTIDISKYKNLKYDRVNTPDILVIGLAITDKYRIYPMNEIIFNSKEPKTSPQNMVIIGYPSVTLKPTEDFEKRNPLISYGSSYTDYSKSIRDNNNLKFELKDETAGPGNSGSPVYFISGKNEVNFAGMLFSGNKETKTAFLVRAEYIKNILYQLENSQ